MRLAGVFLGLVGALLVTNVFAQQQICTTTSNEAQIRQAQETLASLIHYGIRPSDATVKMAYASVVTTTVCSDGGIDFMAPDGAGRTRWAPGTFVKEAGGLTIFLVFRERLHAFQTWDSYLQAGGKADLSNVLIYDNIRGFYPLVAEPVAI